MPCAPFGFLLGIREDDVSHFPLSQMSGRSKEEPEINDGDREFLTLARPSFAIDKRESYIPES